MTMLSHVELAFFTALQIHYMNQKRSSYPQKYNILYKLFSTI